MKILIIADSLDDQYAGVHVYTKNMIKHLLIHDKNNNYILIRQKEDERFPLAKQIIVPKLTFLPGFASLRLFFIIPIIARLLKVNAVIEPAHFGPFNLPKKIKRITIIHDLTPIIFPHFHRFHSQLLQRIFLKRILKKSNLIIANSSHTKKDIIKHYPFTEKKVHSILLGKNNKFKPNYNSNKINRFKIEANKYFLYLGTIEPRKNLILLLEAYTLFLQKSNASIKLVIAGSKGWKNNEFNNAIKNHPFKENIVLTGYIEQESLNQLYTNALAFIYPSFYEGFGLPILEAMTCGCPIICSNTSSMPEVVGNSGLLFNPHSANELLKQLNHIIEKNTKSKLSKESLKQSEKFSWDIFAKKFISILSKSF